jgi:hypothetical protein
MSAIRDENGKEGMKYGKTESPAGEAQT